MPFHRPTSLTEAVAIRAGSPEAVPIAGGTDLMVEVNAGQRHPDALLDLTAVPELAGWRRDGSRVRLGAAVTYRTVLAELAGVLPGLAAAARTVGSPQIRNRGTIGGNLATASPAGDALPPLVASGAEVEIASVRGTRRVPVTDFFTGVKQTVLADDELISAVHVPVATGPQQFAKIGGRSAMVIATCSFALTLDPAGQRVGTALGSAAPTVLRAVEAERFLAEELASRDLWRSREPLPDTVAERFGALVGEAAAPIDDLRGTASYRRHALAVIARRTLRWAWQGTRPAGTSWAGSDTSEEVPWHRCG